jgi:hypothetical protein
MDDTYLIDTILRLMPVPPLFIRLTIDPIQKRAVREVVDGQQRLRAVFAYIRGEFPVLKVHNAEFGGMYYTDLPPEVQRSFLGYKFMVNALQDISDAEVLSIFARMNTYTAPLEHQELRNATFFGAFKQTMYGLALQHYAFWRNNGVLTDAKISRMADAELVSELVISMLAGIRQTKTKDLDDFYQLYDDDFPQASKVTQEFEETIEIIGNMFGPTLLASPFRRIPLFYSVFCAVYDAKFGLPQSTWPRLSFDANQSRLVAKGLRRLGGIIDSEKPPEEYEDFVDAARLSTADPGKRRLRHKFIWEQVLMKAV